MKPPRLWTGSIALLLSLQGASCSLLFDSRPQGNDAGLDEIFDARAVTDAEAADAEPPPPPEPCELPASYGSPIFHAPFDADPPDTDDVITQFVTSLVGLVAAHGTVAPCAGSWSFEEEQRLVFVNSLPSVPSTITGAATLRAVVQATGSMDHNTATIVSMDKPGDNAGDMGLFLHDDGSDIRFVFRIQDGSQTGSQPGHGFHLCSPRLALVPAAAKTYEVRVFIGNTENGPSAPTMFSRQWSEAEAAWSLWEAAITGPSVVLFGAGVNETYPCGLEVDSQDSTVDLEDNNNELWIGGSNSGTESLNHFPDGIADVAMWNERKPNP